jgi:hypothetical protein
MSKLRSYKKVGFSEVVCFCAELAKRGITCMYRKLTDFVVGVAEENRRGGERSPVEGGIGKS